MCGADKPGRSLLGILPIDHLIIEGKNVVLIPNSAAIVRVYKLDHF